MGDTDKVEQEPHPQSARRFAPHIETPSRAGARFGEFRFVVTFL